MATQVLFSPCSRMRTIENWPGCACRACWTDRRIPSLSLEQYSCFNKSQIQIWLGSVLMRPTSVTQIALVIAPNDQGLRTEFWVCSNFVGDHSFSGANCRNKNVGSLVVGVHRQLA